MSTLASLTVRLGIDTGPLRAGAERAKRTLAGLGKTAKSVGSSMTSVMGLATAGALTLSAALVSAGVAAGALGLAMQPQLKAMQESSAAADKLAKAREDEARKKVVADRLSAQGSDLAEKATNAYTTARLATKDAEEAYARQTKGMPKATADAALAFASLKTQFQSWSDSLSSTTMPIFTKGIQLLSALLPSLTPLVKAAAHAFSDFLDGLKGNQGSISGFLQNLAGSAEKNLGAFLRSIKNVFIGVAGIIQALLPMNTEMTGGIEKATAKFAEFGQSLSGSTGFAQFIALSKQAGGTLVLLATAGGNLLVAIGPLVGVTAQIATGLAKLINAVPPSVLSAIATAILVVAVSLKLMFGAIRLVTLALDAWAVIQAIINAELWANPVTWIVLAIVALIAVIVLIATKTNFFQTIWHAAWNGIKTATSVAVDAIKATIHWFAGLPDMFAGWFNAAKDAVVNAFNATVNWVKGVPGMIVSALSSLAGNLSSTATHAGASFVSGIKDKGSSAISYVKSLPGKAKSALGNLGNMLLSAGKSLIRGFINGIKSMISSVKNTLGGITSKLGSWKGPITLDRKILTPNGEVVMAGFMRGISSQVPALRRQLGGITSDLTSMAVGVTPSGVFRTSNQNSNSLTLDVTGADGDMKRLIRRMVQTDGRGSVQTAFGR